MNRLDKKQLLVFLLLCLPFFGWAQNPARYNYVVELDTAKHYLNVELTYNPKDTKELILKMPVWAPGYYLIMDFPKHLTDFAVQTNDGKEIGWRKEGKNAWIIPNTNGQTLKVTYRIYANARSVADSRVESHTAFIAPNGVFMYAEGKKNEPIEVTYILPENWQNASSGLKVKGNANGKHRTFIANDFDILYDSPVLLGNHLVKKFIHEGHEYEFALETPEGFEESPFEDDFRKMVTASSQMMGHVPYDNYCLIHLGRGPGGLEHSNSQACYTSGTFRFPNQKSYLNYMAFTTHEYFHLYNVKAIRPIELGPFDYDKEVHTPTLWIGEGFTVYYETQLLLRAGIIDKEYLLTDLSGYIRDTETTEGHRHMSLRQSSYDIWLNFFNRAANGNDVRISYYIKGPVMGLLFDIRLRELTQGKKSLDDLMRLLYNRYYLKENRGFTEEEFWTSAEEISGAPLPLLRKYVDTTVEIDYDKMLAPAGLRLNKSTWKLETIPSMSSLQEKIHTDMFGK